MNTAIKKKHGVIVTRGMKHNSKSVWNRGHRMVTYRRPHAEVLFR